MDTRTQLNGQSTNQIAENLQEEATIGYHPSIPLEALWANSGDMPQITLRRDLEFMRIHPIVMTTMEYYKSGIAAAQFWGGPDFMNPDNPMGEPISEDPRVSQFVLKLIDQFWQNYVPLLQEDGYPYGWVGGEYIYKEIGGLLTLGRLKVFHPHDAHILSYKEFPVGIRVKNIRNKNPIDMHFAANHIPAKGCWYAHRPRAGSFYGRSQYEGAWRPWRRLGWRDAIEQVIDAAIYRAGYKGPVVRHPQESGQVDGDGIPGTRLDGQGKPRRSARDVARQIVEWAKAGAGFTLSSATYPQAMGGGKKWDVEWPEHVMDVRPLIEAAKYVEDQIMLGIGVPPELIRSGGTGSGYQGRSVPREAFMSEQQRVAGALLHMFVEQVVRPLVLWNFGDIPFQVACKSLLKIQTENTQGQPGQPGEGNVDLNKSQAAKDAWARRKAADPTVAAGAPQVAQNPPPQPAPAPAPAPALSMEPSTKVIDIVRRVMNRYAA